MKFQWRMPDKTEVTINHPDEIARTINDLKAEHDTAVNDGSIKTAAAIKLQYNDQLKQWGACMAHLYLDKQKELSALITRTKQALAWWDELSSHDAGDETLSELQEALLADVPANRMPESWIAASWVINSDPNFRPPSDDLEAARVLLAEKLSIASTCVQMADSLKNKFWNGERPTQGEIDAFHAKFAQLQGAEHDSGL